MMDSDDGMQYEYDSLRQELLEWQNRRITLLTTSCTVATGVLTFGQAFGPRIPWWTISIVLLVLLSAACYLTGYAGHGNQRIGAFLQVFHDPAATLKWETRNAVFKKLAQREWRGSNLNQTRMALP
jgi:cell division protein FtsW (lipid II flippase)